ncbi:hypothetical protein ACQXZ3_08640 [Corynebacterium diphtheriae]
MAPQCPAHRPQQGRNGFRRGNTQPVHGHLLRHLRQGFDGTRHRLRRLPPARRRYSGDCVRRRGLLLGDYA